MFSLSEILFNFLSASTWIILKNKMFSEKSRLQKDKYNMPPVTYMFRIHICNDAYMYVYAKHFSRAWMERNTDCFRRPVASARLSRERGGPGEGIPCIRSIPP